MSHQFRINKHVATFIAEDGSGVALYHRLSGSTQLIAQFGDKPQSAYDILGNVFTKDQFLGLFDSSVENPERILLACVHNSFIDTL